MGSLSYVLNGYGTADGIMYPNLLLYFPAILRIIGVPVVVAWNIFWIFIIVLGVFTAFIGYTIWTGNIRAGAVATIFFLSVRFTVFCLGHALGDFSAFMAMPLVFGVLFKIFESEKNAKYWPLLFVGFTLIFETHVITTLFVSILIFPYIIFNYKALKSKIIRVAVLKAAVFSALVNLWFAVPFAYFYEKVSFQINTPRRILSLHEVTCNFFEIASAQFFLGIPVLIVIIAFLIYKKTRYNKGFILALFIYAFILLTNHEYFPWLLIENNLPGGSFLPNFQFAIRFIPFGVLLIALYIGVFFAEYIKKRTYLCSGISVIFVSSLVFASFLPVYYGHDPVYRGGYLKLPEILPSYSTVDYHVQEDYLYSDTHFNRLRNERGEVYDSNDYKTDAKLSDIKKLGTRLEFSYVATKDTKVQVPLFYWKGYEARNEKGERLNLSSGEHRFMEVEVPKGEGKVYIHYAGLWSFRICDIISLISLIVFLYLWRKEWKNYA